MSQPCIGFVSFAGGHLRWKFAKARLLRQVKVSKRFHSVEIYTEKKLHEIISPEIAKFISDNHFGYGLWIWKPIVVLDFLKRNPLCDSILYLDAGCDFNYSKLSRKRWHKYLGYLRHFDALIFQTPHVEESYSSVELVTRLRSKLSHMQSGQIHAGAFLMTRSFAEDFCNEWLDVMSEDRFKLLKNEIIGESVNLFDTHIDYRYDQSIFSLLVKQKLRVKILQDEETDFAPTWKAGLYFPILTSRNRSIIPILKEGLIHRALRRIERRVIRTYNSFNEYNRNQKLKC